MDIQRCMQGLLELLQKYNVRAPQDALFSADGAFTAAGRTVRLLPWRQERRLIEMKKLLHGGQAGMPCVLRTGRIVPRADGLKAQLRRELDVSEWLFESEAASVYMVQSGGAANLIVRLKNGVVCTLELAATLKEGAAVLDRHEINTRRGVISDRAVDTQVPQASVYTFCESGAHSYTDVDFELYGLLPEEAACVRSAFELLQRGAWDEYAKREARIDALCAAAQKSAAENRRVFLTGEGM